MSQSPDTSLLSRVATGLGRIVRIADRLGETMIITLFAGIVLVGGLQVCCRYLLNMSLSWSEEFQRYGLIWLVFLAIVTGYRRAQHLGMDFLAKKLPTVAQTGLAWTTDLLWLALGLAMIGFTAFFRSPAGFTFLHSVSRQSSAGMGLRMDIVYGCMVIGGAYLTLAATYNLALRLAGRSGEIALNGGESC
jgi:TRAP-type transport system small permease protein